VRNTAAFLFLYFIFRLFLNIANSVQFLQEEMLEMLRIRCQEFRCTFPVNLGCLSCIMKGSGVLSIELRNWSDFPITMNTLKNISFSLCRPAQKAPPYNRMECIC